VTERLRKVAQHAPIEGVVVLGQQADVIAQARQSLEQGPRVVIPAQQHVHVGQPK
jgi:hypothetical protein